MATTSKTSATKPTTSKTAAFLARAIHFSGKTQAEIAQDAGFANGISPAARLRSHSRNPSIPRALTRARHSKKVSGRASRRAAASGRRSSWLTGRARISTAFVAGT